MGSLDVDGGFRSTSRASLEVTDGVAVVTLENPPVNAIDVHLVGELAACLDAVEADPGVRVVVLTGSGDALFSAGSDILEISTLLAPGAAVEHKLTPQFETFGRLADLPVPTIAALNGHALGGGLEVAACCDLIVAEEQVLIGSPEIRLGLFPSSGGTFRVARRIGPARAKEMQLIGRPVSARTAEAWGLVNRVVPTGDALTAALELARELCARPAIGLRAVKDLVDRSAGDDGALVVRSKRHSELAFTSDDATEGVTAFLAKRGPAAPERSTR